MKSASSSGVGPRSQQLGKLRQKEVQGLPGLQKEVKDSLGNVWRPCLKIEKVKKKAAGNAA